MAYVFGYNGCQLRFVGFHAISFSKHNKTLRLIPSSNYHYCPKIFKSKILYAEQCSIFNFITRLKQISRHISEYYNPIHIV